LFLKGLPMTGHAKQILDSVKEAKTKPFTGKGAGELPYEIQIFIAGKLRRGWAASAIQTEAAGLFGLFIPEAFICC